MTQEQMSMPVATAGGGAWPRVQAWLVIGGIIAAIAVAEYIFAYQNVAYGIIIALALALAIYLVVSLARLSQPLINSAETLALIPLYVLFTSSLPWFFINQQFLLPAVYAAIVALCLWHIYRNRLTFTELGFRKHKLWQYSIMGLAVGIPLGFTEYFIIVPAPAFPTFQLSYFFRDMTYMVLFVGIGEELLFRGIIQSSLSTTLGWKTGLFLTSLTFGIMHMSWRSVPELGFTFVVALILGYIFYRTKSLVAPIVAHGIGNTMLVAVSPYLFGQ